MTESIADEIKRRVQETHKSVQGKTDRSWIRRAITLEVLDERIPRAVSMDEIRDGMMAIVRIMETDQHG